MLSKIAYRLARRYIRKYEGFSYDFHVNGEALLVTKLKAIPVRTIFDVGANVGEWTCMSLKEFPNAIVHVFEISAQTFQTLTERIDSDRAILNHLGLSSQEGSTEYKDYGPGAAINTIVAETDFHDKWTPHTIQTANMTTGDKYCELQGVNTIDFLKIDVEGAEGLVLQGFRRMLESGSIRIVQFEYGYSSGDAHFLMKDYFKFFSSFNYKVGVLKPKGVIFSDFEYGLNNFESGPNFVAVPKSDAEIVRAISA